MITDSGKDIMAKYLLGQVPAYATHLAVGCGAVPLDSNDTAPSSSILKAKQKLDFEMTRVPIVSKGFVDDNGTTKISLTAELPTENRYEITEIGLWSAPNNTLAVGSDSHILFNFSDSWQVHDTSIYSPPVKANIGTADIDQDVLATEKIFYVGTDNVALQTIERKNRKEGPRFLNQTLLVRGDSATISGSNGSWSISNTSSHIHLNNFNFDISQNSPSDELSLAFSLIDKSSVGANGVPDTIKIFIEFYRNEATITNGYAKKEITLSGGDFVGNSYHIVSFPISSLITSADFSASDINICRISTSIIKSGNPSANYYLAYDAMRIDNITTINPLYKLSGYSVVRTTAGYPIIKSSNTNNYVEFRFNLGVQ